MTQIAFHFGAPDRLQYTCRLLRKVVGAGMRAVVWAPDELLQTLDRSLWAVSPTDFVPHASAGQAADAVVQRSPVRLVSVMPDTIEPGQVLVNLHPEWPQAFAQFARVIEVVSIDGPDRDSARAKWRQYTAAGHTIQRHDLQLREAA